MTRARHRLSSWILCATSVLAFAGVPRPARAGEGGGNDATTREAKEHFYRGEKLFALGRFEQALAAYEAAFEAKQLPEFLFNIGQCHANLGDYRQAIFSLRKYLRLRPHADNRAEVEEYIASLEEKQKREERTLALVPKDGKTGTERPRKRAFYTRWWFWTGVVAVAGAGTAALLLNNRGPDLPSTDLGNLEFGK